MYPYSMENDRFCSYFVQNLANNEYALALKTSYCTQHHMALFHQKTKRAHGELEFSIREGGGGTGSIPPSAQG